MKTKSNIEIYKEPLSASFEDLEEADIEVFFVLGIVNPNGPTLSFIASIGKPYIGQKLPIVHVMLNPFLQTYKQIGRLELGEQFDAEVVLEPLYHLDFGDCPSLIILSSMFNEETRINITRRILSNFDSENVDNTCSCIEANLGDPWTRVSEILGGRLPTITSIGKKSIKRLSEIVLTSEHFWPELQAFNYAWEGSIEKSGISDNLKNQAFPYEKMKNFFFDRLAPHLFIPEPLENKGIPPKVQSQKRYIAKTSEDLRATLYQDSWDEFTLDQLADVLTSAILLYGKEINMEDIPYIGRLYAAALHRGMDEDTRLFIECTVLDAVDNLKVSPVVFIPFLVYDPSQPVASKAVIDFISESPYVDGELYAIKELRPLFKKKTLEKPGMVFGGIVAIGDSELESFLDEIFPTLSVEEVRAAARVHTSFLKHETIQYWLRKATSLALREDEESQGKFGSCASALILCLDHDQTKTVVDAKRDFPCSGKESPVNILKSWSIEEYADLLAADFYKIEAEEQAPRLFSAVLRAWGLKPRAPIIEQFIPQDSKPSEDTRKLHDPQEK